MARTPLPQTFLVIQPPPVIHLHGHCHRPEDGDGDGAKPEPGHFSAIVSSEKSDKSHYKNIKTPKTKTQSPKTKQTRKRNMHEGEKIISEEPGSQKELDEAGQDVEGCPTTPVTLVTATTRPSQNMQHACYCGRYCCCCCCGRQSQPKGGKCSQDSFFKPKYRCPPNANRCIFYFLNLFFIIYLFSYLKTKYF